jgi:hypothetical protein
MANTFTFQIIKSNDTERVVMTHGDEVLEFSNGEDAFRFASIMNSNTDNGWTYLVYPIKDTV